MHFQQQTLRCKLQLLVNCEGITRLIHVLSCFCAFRSDQWSMQQLLARSLLCTHARFSKLMTGSRHCRIARSQRRSCLDASMRVFPKGAFSEQPAAASLAMLLRRSAQPNWKTSSRSTSVSERFGRRPPAAAPARAPHHRKWRSSLERITYDAISCTNISWLQMLVRSLIERRHFVRAFSDKHWQRESAVYGTT